MSPGGKGLANVLAEWSSLAPSVQPYRLWKEFLKMSLKIYNFSTMQNIRIQYELYEGLHGPKRTETAALMSQLVRKILRKEIKGFRG